MRTLLLSILLASAAATPALADRPDREDRQAARAERQAARAERQQSQPQRSAPERPQVGGQAHFNGAVNGGQQAIIRGQGFRQNGTPDQSDVQAFRGERRQQMIEARRQQAADGSLRQADRPLPGVFRPRTRTPVVRDAPREGTQPRLRDDRRRHDGTRWSTGWRNDHRYDWYNWRSRHRSLFHFGFYTDPFGWGYQPYSIGWRLWPSYYGRNYWINDPWQYRLPYAPPGYRWIRYYDDAVLVDTFSGEVVDVIRNFFW